MHTDDVIGYLSYYSNTGQINNMIPYDNADEMKADLLEDMDCGRPVRATVFQRRNQALAITPEWFADHCESVSARYHIEAKPSRRAKSEVRE